MKHGIKQSDRLIGNDYLYQEREGIYQAISHGLIGQQPRPIIVVDWSEYTYNQTYLILRAAVPAGGRALTLYEEVHPRRCYGNARVHKRFLKALQQLLPASCKPIIVTDAGFTGPWFRVVQQLGWDYLGRIWRSLLYRKNAQGDWLKCRDLFEQATGRPRYYGAVELVRVHPFACHLYLYRKPKQGRHIITHYGHKARSRRSLKHARRESVPWILATSLGPDEVCARQVIQLYRTRMQIEEAFRDIKNYRTGFSLSDTRSRSQERLANLLLVGMLATFMVWLLGRLAEANHWQYQYQANTVRHQRVLSLFYLGCLLARQSRYQLTQQEFKRAFNLVRQDMMRQWQS